MATLYMTLSRRCKKKLYDDSTEEERIEAFRKKFPSTKHLILTETSSPIITYSQAHVVWDARVTAMIKA